MCFVGGVVVSIFTMIACYKGVFIWLELFSHRAGDLDFKGIDAFKAF